MMTTLGFATNMRLPRNLQVTPGGFLQSFLQSGPPRKHKGRQNSLS